MTKEIILSDLGKEVQIARLNTEFEGLGEDETATVISTDNYYSAIKEFQQQHGGRFIWAALLEGNPVYKGVLTKPASGSKLTQSVYNYMAKDHTRCDDLYAKGESALLEGDNEVGGEAISGFITGMLRHFKIEEEVLFPTFEENTGMIGGPTEVMRMEHTQMKGILSQMQAAVASGDFGSIAGLGETLVILMQQHNMKEENMLYPMMEQHLSDQLSSLIDRAQLIDC